MFPSPPGFLGTRADALTDLVFLAILLILPLVGFSVYQVRAKQFSMHRTIQAGLTLLLTVVVSVFELNLNAKGGLYELARGSRWLNSPAFDVLFYIHLGAASLTAAVWLGLVFASLLLFPRPPRPGAFSRLHKVLGWIGVVGMGATGLTGGLFYLMAFWD